MDDLGDLRLAIDATVAQGGRGVAERVARACLAVLPGDGAAISLMTSGEVWEILVAADDVAARLDEAQYTVGEGPSWDAFSSGRAVLVRDLTGRYAVRWPGFVDAVADLAIGGVFAFPLQVGAITIGVCVVYTRGVVGLDADELRLAFGVTGIAALALTGLRDGREVAGPEEALNGVGWLGDVFVDRRQVHQATGVLIDQLGLDAEAAFARLRAYAFGIGRPVGEVAAEIVAGRLRLDSEPP